jgi:hypothetical protein
MALEIRCNTFIKNTLGKGDAMMKKIRIALILACLMLPLVTLTVFAGAPMNVGGTFTYWPDPDGDIKVAGPNMFFPSKDTEWWAGDLEGTAETTYTLILHGLDPFSDPGQFISKGEFAGTVLGSDEGTAAFQLTGHQFTDVPWYGTWSIGQGKQGLAGIHGQGTWWLCDSVNFVFCYEGKVH